MISSYASAKLKWLTVAATLTVVWIHSNAAAFLSNIPRPVDFIANFLMLQMTSWAVPCFFMISGFLFVHSYRDSYKKFLGKKTKSLLFPYFSWAVIGTVLAIPLFLACNWLQKEPLLRNTFWERSNYSVWKSLDLILGIIQDGPLNNGPLWYVRVLFLLFLISPVFMLVYKSCRWPILECIIASVLIYYFNSKAVMLDILMLKPWAVVYFLLGMAAAKINFWEKRFPVWLVAACGICYLLLAMYDAAVYSAVLKSYSILFYPWKVFCAIIFMSGMYDIGKDYADRLVKYIPMTFFIYCFHQPVLAYFMSMNRFLFRNNAWVLLLFCVLSFVCTLIICISAAKLLERFKPEVYRFLTGGR